MATIRPFGALRFTSKAGGLEDLTCPPYDIISEEERRQYLARNRHNIIRLELPREGEEPYRTAGETYAAWLEEGILVCDGQPALYIYEERFAIGGVEKSIKGLVCLVRLEEFSAGVVLPHEETISKAKDDRFRLMCATGCNFSSIYSLYFDKNKEVYSRLQKLSKTEPEMDFTGPDGLSHRVWRISDTSEVDALVRGFSDKKLYIADGHHRYETGLRYKRHLLDEGLLARDDESHPGNYIMMTLVHMEDEGLVVQPTHRVVQGLGVDTQKLLEGCEEFFELRQIGGDEAEREIAAAAEVGRKALALYGDKRWTLLTLKGDALSEEMLPEASPAYRRLDVSILHTLVLERLLGIDAANMANQTNLRYTRDIAEAVGAVDADAADCVFIIGATGVEEIAAVATAGEKMPQKSTYFYPKLITGHIMNKILDL